MDSDGADAREELIAAKEASAARDRIDTRITREKDQLGGAQLELQAARAQLDIENDDVQRLESFSPTRIWAGLRGRRDAELERERAEHQRAHYGAAVAKAAVASALEQLHRSEAERAALGDVDERWDRAVAGLDVWIGARGGEGGAELRDVTQQLATARSDAVELGEAQAAAAQAATRLRDAQALLGKAGDWAAWDTFGGGGIITDAFKYDRMDQAAAVMRQADQALKQLTGELADIGLAGTGGISVDGWDRAFDVWFDNIFSDWAVRDRIGQAQQRTDVAARAVHALRVELDERLTRTQASAATLAARQIDLASSLSSR